MSLDDLSSPPVVGGDRPPRLEDRLRLMAQREEVSDDITDDEFAELWNELPWSLEEWRELVTLLREAAEALAAARGRSSWQPIETAPKDGSSILVYFKTIGIFQVFWSEEPFSPGIGCWCVTDNKNEDRPLRGYCDEDATHWAALPPDPSQET